jgi:polysaccharide biosynthesis protein PslE
MSNSVQTDRPLDLGGMYHRNRGKMLFAFLMVLGLTIAYTLVSSKKFTSDAKLFVRLGRETIGLDPTATTGEMVSIQASREYEMNSIGQLIDSREVMTQAVEKLGCDSILRKDEVGEGMIASRLSEFKAWVDSVNPLYVDSPRDDAIELLQSKTHVDIPARSQVISVSYTGESPERAQQVLQEIINSSIEVHLRVNRTSGSDDFFSKQSDRLRNEVATLEGEVLQFKNRTGITDFERQRGHAVDRIATLQMSLLETQSASQSAKVTLENHEQELANRPKELVLSQVRGVPQSSAQMMRQQLYQLEMREGEAAATYTEGHPILTRIRQEVDTAQKTLNSENPLVSSTHGLDPTWMHVERIALDNRTLAKSLDAKANLLREQLAAEDEGLRSINASELELATLTRKLELAKANYLNYASKFEQTRIDNELNIEGISNISVLQSPSTSLIPSRPRPALYLCIGVVLGIFAATIITLVSELRLGVGHSVKETRATTPAPHGALPEATPA